MGETKERLEINISPSLIGLRWSPGHGRKMARETETGWQEIGREWKGRFVSHQHREGN